MDITIKFFRTFVTIFEQIVFSKTNAFINPASDEFVSTNEWSIYNELYATNTYAGFE